MLTPNDIHYIVGIFCKLTTPDNVSIMLGDMVYDIASEKERDVDVTISYKNENGEEISFVGYEVKDEGRPLDQAKVEQLCQKFRDIQSIKKGGIISASGYAEPAIKKAKFHGIDLYEFKTWDKDVEKFANISFAEGFKVHELRFEFLARPLFTYIFDDKIQSEQINFTGASKVLDRNKNSLPNNINNIGQMTQNLLDQALNSPNIKSTLIPENVDKEIPININVEIAERPLLVLQDKEIAIRSLNITGRMKIILVENRTEVKVLVKQDDSSCQIGAAISEMNGRLICFATIKGDSNLHFNVVQVPDRLKNKIFRKKIK